MQSALRATMRLYRFKRSACHLKGTAASSRKSAIHRFANPRRFDPVRDGMPTERSVGGDHGVVPLPHFPYFTDAGARKRGVRPVVQKQVQGGQQRPFFGRVLRLWMR